MDKNIAEQILELMTEGVYIINKDGYITYWNNAAERISGYTKEMVLGKKCSDNLLKHVSAEGVELCVNGCPLAACMKDGKRKEAEVFLHHRDGHRIPITVRAIPLPNADKSGFDGSIELFIDRSERSRLLADLEEIRRESLTDKLTGLGNRRFADINLEKAMQDAKDEDFSFSILLMDIDFFKNINDVYGHLVGDKVIKMVAATLANSVRKMDAVARWGGEEFLVILPNVTRQRISIIAEHIRALIKSTWLTLDDGTQVKVTVSLGGAEYKKEEPIIQLIDRADHQLYIAKTTGRDRFSIAE